MIYNEILNKIIDLNLLKTLPKNLGVLGQINTKLKDFNTNIDISDISEIKFIINYLELNNINKLICVIRTKDDPFIDNECPSSYIKNDLKKILKTKNIDYYEFIQEPWPIGVPNFHIEKNMFVLKFGYDESCFIDKIASNKDFVKSSFENLNFNTSSEKINFLFHSNGVLYDEI